MEKRIANKVNNYQIDFKEQLKCDKVLVQKSGYFSRSAAPNEKDLKLIDNHAVLAVECAINNSSCVVGINQYNNELTCINFNQIKGGKKFDIKAQWFVKLMKDIEC